MFNKKEKDKSIRGYSDISINTLKKLNLFDSVDGEWNELGFRVIYTRVPGGLIRLVINTEAMDQIFIALPPQWFTI